MNKKIITLTLACSVLTACTGGEEEKINSCTIYYKNGTEKCIETTGSSSTCEEQASRPDVGAVAWSSGQRCS